MKNIVFSKSKMYTLGVELEFQLCDQTSLNLVPRANEILTHFSKGQNERIALEFLQSIIEIQTGVCECVSEVASDLSRTIQLVEDVAGKEQCILYSASLHPFAEPTQQEVSPGKRYKRIMEELQLVGRQFISQGLHVHVGVGDGDTAIRLCDVFQAYLPILLSLSTSSPYFCGLDTGFCSYRTKLFEALPLAGIAGFLGSWQNYVDEVSYLHRLHIIEKINDLWWDVRPSPGFGTVEIRICDIPSRFIEILGLTAVIQAFAAYIIDSSFPAKPLDLQLLRSNKWQAARHGLHGRFNDTYGILGQEMLSFKSAATSLLTLIKPYAARFKTLDYLQVMHDVVRNNTSCERQRSLIKQGITFEEMISRLRDDYWKI